MATDGAKRRIDGVIFDVDETLLYESETEGEAFAEVCTTITGDHESGLRLRDTLFHIAEQAWQWNPRYEFTKDVGISSREGLWGDFQAGIDGIEQGARQALLELASWVEAYRITCWELALEASGYGEADPESASVNTHRVRNRYHRPFPDAVETLTSIGGSRRIGILTNGAPGVQHAKIVGAGIARYVDAIVVSGEVGHGKPHPSTFGAISTKLDVPPGRCLMVGDNLEKDVRGAIGFGMEAVLFDRSRNATGVDVRYRIESLAELPDLIAFLDEQV